MRLPVVRNLHAKTIGNIYNFFKTDKGKQIVLSGWKAAGILDISADELIDPFSRLAIN